MCFADASIFFGFSHVRLDPWPVADTGRCFAGACSRSRYLRSNCSFSEAHCVVIFKARQRPKTYGALPIISGSRHSAGYMKSIFRETNTAQNLPANAQLFTSERSNTCLFRCSRSVAQSMSYWSCLSCKQLYILRLSPLSPVSGSELPTIGVIGLGVRIQLFH